MLRTIFSGCLVLAHVALLIWYYSLSREYKLANDATCAFAFFGIQFLIMGINNLTAPQYKHWVHHEILRFQNLFIVLLGTIYALHYSGVYITENRGKLLMIFVGLFIMFVIVLISMWKHGFLNKKTYDR